MENQVEETGTERLGRLREEARQLGIVGTMTADQFEAAIKAKKESIPIVESEAGITPEDAKKIDARLKYEEEARQKFKHDRQVKLDRASITAESEAAGIPIDLPENPTEIELARARTKLGIEKTIPKPSPETLGIEASKRGYYIFTNREQDDAAHTTLLGGKYTINLIPDQVHVLSEYHIKKWRQIAVVPTYERVPVPGEPVEGQMGEECKRVGGKQRFAFEFLGEAPANAPFGLVTDSKVLDKLQPKEQFV